MQNVLVYPEAIVLFSEDWKRECNFQSIPCLDHLAIPEDNANHLIREHVNK